MTTTRGTVAAGLAVGLAIALAGCTADGPDLRNRHHTNPVQLTAFDSCREALHDLKRNAKLHVGPYGFRHGRSGSGPDLLPGTDRADGEAAKGAPAAPGGAPADPGGGDPGGQDHSGTNNHEAGVDEPDVVKTDGRRIVTVVDGTLRVVDVASRRQTGELVLDEGAARTQAHLLVDGDRALVVLPGYRRLSRPDGEAPAGETEVPVTGPRLLLVDLAGEPRVISRMTIDGEYVDARLVGGEARLVTRSVPRIQFGPSGGSGRDGKSGPSATEDAVRDNRVRLAGSRIDAWLPRYEVETNGTVTSGQVGCERVSHPVAYSGTSMLTVTTLGLGVDQLSGDRAVTVVADGRTVYGTGTSLYVAHDRRYAVPFRDARTAPADPAASPPTPPQPAKPRTEIFKFDVSKPGVPRHTASGAVPGWLLNQYAMSEHRGHLRVATTTGQRSAGPEDGRASSQSAVYVLAVDGNRLETVGHVGGLGKDERIYAVRFVGSVGYVVTFRRVDPLYVIDLADPEHPKAVGELKISGYSAYLHPAGPKRLIGVGQEADTQGRRLGTQVSLFDVGDPTAPSRLARHHLGYGNSAVEFDPHAFLYWPKTGLLVIPVSQYEDETVPRGVALVLRVSDSGLTKVGMVSHPSDDYAATVQRSLMIGDTLWTLSRTGLQANDADTLDKQEWLPFD